MIPRRDVTAFHDIAKTALSAWRCHGAQKRLEAVLAREWDVAVARVVSSGRAGLAWLLRAAREVGPPVAYVPAYTIRAIPEIVRSCGYRVEFLDVDPETLSVTPEMLERAWRGPGVAIVTHYFGLPADMVAILKIAGDLGLEVVEDCAHVPGGRVGGRAVGTFGLGGSFSFETRKPLNALGGGCVVSCDDRIRPRLSQWVAPKTSPGQDALKFVFTTMEWFALRRPVFRAISPLLHGSAGKRFLLSIYRGTHAVARELRELSDFRAALVLGQLNRLNERTRYRRALARVYDELLPGDVTRPISTAERPHQYYMYVIQHPRAAEFGRFLRRNGVDCGIGDDVLPNCAPPGVAPFTETVVNRTIELPMHEGLRFEDAERICDIAHQFR